MEGSQGGDKKSREPLSDGGGGVAQNTAESVATLHRAPLGTIKNVQTKVKHALSG